MAHVKINDTITVKTVDGEEQLSGVVLCFKHIQFSEPNQVVKFDYAAYKSEQAYQDNAIPLQNVLSTQQREMIVKDKVIKGTIPVFIEHIKSAYGLTDVVDLKLINTAWHTEDSEGNPIDLEARKTRVFLTWRQATKFTRLYTDLVQLLIQIGIPIVEDNHGQWMYFEYIDDPQGSGTPAEDALNSVGAYIERK
jgi:hypothetical protein